MSAAQPIAEELRQLDDLIARAREEMADGAAVDLSTWEQRLRQVCTRIHELPGGEAHQHLAQLLAVRDKLEQLAKEMEAALQELAGRLETAGGWPEASDPGPGCGQPGR